MRDYFDPEPVLNTLKDFQRSTVEYVFRRMYLDKPEARRFLVADEVGLGKTMVARGVIAKAIRQLQEDPDIDRIDIVYICSNGAIAKQNINRLNVLGTTNSSLATRLTLLPLELHDLDGREINFVSFTPGTTFNLKSSTGIVKERALIYHMLEGHLDIDQSGLYNLLQGDVYRKNWKRWIQGDWKRDQFDPKLQNAFVRAVVQESTLFCKLKNGCEEFSQYRETLPKSARDIHNQVVGELRKSLARVCVDALEPDLVILDEFQRFKDLLGGESEAAELAQALMGYKDARTLMLSATPYKMLTLYHEDEDDHYADFLHTLRFLYGNEAAVEALKDDLARYRTGLYSHEDIDAVRVALENRLKQVMVRTERVGASRDRDAMLREIRFTPRLEATDLYQARAIDKIANAVGAHDTVEYWKSAPYLLNFMKRYELKRRLETQLDAPSLSPELSEALSLANEHAFSLTALKHYEPIDPANGRLRTLMEETLGKEAWRQLWISPSLPYTRPEGPFAQTGQLTKSLIFSAWNVVPDAIAAITSYEAERQRVRQSYEGQYENLSRERKGLLTFRRKDERLDSMPVLLMLYPSPTLARLADPLKLVLDSDSGEPLPLHELVSSAQERLKDLIPDRASDSAALTQREDHARYWRTIARADRSQSLADWCHHRSGWPTIGEHGKSTAAQPEESLFIEHARSFAGTMMASDKPEGAIPSDIEDVLCEIALGSPAVCAARSLRRIAPGLDYADTALMTAAATVAEGFRSFFNSPDVRCLIESRETPTPYWREVLRYCMQGNLQAVLDEYAHFLVESLGLFEESPGKTVREVALAMLEALSLRTASLDVDEIKPDGEEGAYVIDKQKIRCRFGLRFGDLHDDSAQVLNRAGSVRSAFNSPFRPFILASTSVGQEGLDFHGYCHRIWHWNLPGNPVDMEQREGRVHRYKGHAIRKNIAKKYGIKGLKESWRDGEDPWMVLFEIARKGREPGKTDLYPYWIFDDKGIDDAAKIERCVVLPPFSSEVARYDYLKRSLAVYRLAFGQPRQEDLVAFLAKNKSLDDADVSIASQLDLSPPCLNE